MPRVGGVYTLLSGSKGAPGTTIQSAAYNSQLDDLAADANTPRPVTAGGTGFTNLTDFKNSLGLSTVATSGSASDLTAGTLADARLPGTMTGKTFTGTTTLDSLLVKAAGGFEGGQIDLQKPVSGSSLSGNIALDVFGNQFRVFDGGNPARMLICDLVSGALNLNGSQFWNSGNDGPGSGLDADVLDGQDGSFYRNASNINAGTIADARLPSSMTSKTFTGNIAVGDAVIQTDGNVIFGGGMTLQGPNLNAALDTKAPNASPALTGSPTAPTAPALTNTTQIATTAMVQAAIVANAPAPPPSGIGIGQTWQVPSRAAQTVYQNTTGRPIMVAIRFSEVNVNARYFRMGPDTGLGALIGPAQNGSTVEVYVIIPNGYYYLTDISSVLNWLELR